MINVSNEFNKLIVDHNKDCINYLDIVLKDGTKLPTISNDEIWDDGFKIDEGVTESGKFTIGSCIINKLTVTLNNIYDTYSEYDFDGAVITAYTGLELSNGTIEKIRKGIYTVDEPQYDGSTISLECLDNMSKLDVLYSGVTTTYPATLGMIARDICSYCGVILLTTTFDNSNYIVSKRPTSEELTCRQVLLYVAQLSCKYARCDTYGRIKLDWFQQELFEQNGLDGGEFDTTTKASYESGDVADGGNFDNYKSGDVIDGGNFEDVDVIHHLYSYSSLSVSTDDVVITGIQVTEEFEETEELKKQTYQYGNDGYVLSISSNPFIEFGKAKEVATYIGNKLIGFRFRPMNGSFIGNPLIEAGDLAYVIDRKGITYHCLMTNLSYNGSGFMTVSCDAETPSKNSAKTYSELTQTIVAARDEAKKQISNYDKAVQMLTTLITQGFGVYKTEEKQTDGSIIYYMHNKPTLKESMTIWKMTADAFAVSTDGGKTWNAGMDSSGNAVVNVLSAIGINFDWARGGTLTLGGNNNGNGLLLLLDANGNEISRMSNSGIDIKNGEITSVYGNRRSEIRGGYINFYCNNDVSAQISPFYWGNDTSKEGATFLTKKSYLGIGYGGTSSIVINNGLNPSGYEEKNIFYGNTRFNDALYCKNGAYFYASSIKGGEQAMGCDGGFIVRNGTLAVSTTGTKNKIFETKDYGTVGITSFETAEPYFADIGSASIVENNCVTVFLDQVFAQTIDRDCSYQVFITRTSEKETDYVEKHNGYFIVHGKNGATFDWMLCAKQLYFSNTRLENMNIDTNKEVDFDESIFNGDNQDLEILEQGLEQYNKEIDLL